MKKLVSLARALKEKNRIAGRLYKARRLVDQNNSHEVKVPRSVDVRETYNESQRLKERLVEVKSAIAMANGPIMPAIVELAEVKSEISYMNDLSVKEGRFEKSGYNTPVVDEYTAVITAQEVQETVSSLMKRAESLQDQLDEFNAMTKVEIEIDD